MRQAYPRPIRLLLSLAVAAAALLLAPRNGLAQWRADEPPPGFHTHDGFFLRLFGGAGYTSTDYEGAGTFSGSGYAFSLALGGAVSRNLVVYGEIAQSMAINPKWDFQGQKLSTNANLGGTIFGPGLAYYFDNEFFVSATLGLGRVVAEGDDGDTRGSSDAGFGWQALLGKLWWVSPNWELGLAGQVLGVAAKDAGNSVSTWGANVLFVAVFN